MVEPAYAVVLIAGFLVLVLTSRGLERTGVVANVVGRGAGALLLIVNLFVALIKQEKF